jgi:hypothetical protein
MSAQEREPKKLFAILNRTEEQRVLASLARLDRPVKNYVRVLMAVVLNRCGDAGT